MKITPRDYQIEDVERIETSYRAGIGNQLIVWATGLGKTLIFSMVHRRINPRRRSMILVDRIELARQAKKSIMRFDPTIRVGIEMNTETAALSDEIVIFSIDTIGRDKSFRITKYKSDHFGKCFMDEAHVGVTPKYDRVLNYFGFSKSNFTDGNLLVGLTATPNRTDGVGLGSLFDDITAQRDLVWGIENGWLTDILYLPVRTGVSLEGVRITRNGEYDEDDLSLRLDVDSRNSLVVKAFEQEGKCEKSLVFSLSVDHAHHLKEIFEHYGYGAEVISHKTPKLERKRIIEAFREEEFPVLLNYGTLTTGFDDTEIRNIIKVRAVRSHLLYQQIVGRGPRPSELVPLGLAKTPKLRRSLIENSVKPYVRVIDFTDDIMTHPPVTLPQLVGLPYDFNANQKRIFKEVVSPVNEAKKKYGVDPSKLKDLKDIKIQVEIRQFLSVKSLNTPVTIKKLSELTWMETKDDTYELNFASDGKSLIVEKNLVDRYDLLIRDFALGEDRKLNDHGFASLQGALNVADQYAKETFDTSNHRWNAAWRRGNKAISQGQFNRLRQICKPLITRGVLKIDWKNRYRDTKVPTMTLNGDVLTKAMASNLLNEQIKNLKARRYEEKRARKAAGR